MQISLVFFFLAALVPFSKSEDKALSLGESLALQGSLGVFMDCRPRAIRQLRRNAWFQAYAKSLEPPQFGQSSPSTSTLGPASTTTTPPSSTSSSPVSPGLSTASPREEPSSCPPCDSSSPTTITLAGAIIVSYWLGFFSRQLRALARRLLTRSRAPVMDLERLGSLAQHEEPSGVVVRPLPDITDNQEELNAVREGQQAQYNTLARRARVEVGAVRTPPKNRSQSVSAIPTQCEVEAWMARSTAIVPFIPTPSPHWTDDAWDVNSAGKVVAENLRLTTQKGATLPLTPSVPAIPRPSATTSEARGSAGGLGPIKEAETITTMANENYSPPVSAWGRNLCLSSPDDQGGDLITTEAEVHAVKTDSSPTPQPHGSQGAAVSPSSPRLPLAQVQGNTVSFDPDLAPVSSSGGAFARNYPNLRRRDQRLGVAITRPRRPRRKKTRVSVGASPFLGSH